MKVRNDHRAHWTPFPVVTVAPAARKSDEYVGPSRVYGLSRTELVVEAEKTHHRLAKFVSMCGPITLERCDVAVRIEIGEPEAHPAGVARENPFSLS